MAFGRIASLFTTRNQILRGEGALSFAFRDAANSSNKISSTMRNRDVIAFAFLVDSKRHRESGYPYVHSPKPCNVLVPCYCPFAGMTTASSSSAAIGVFGFIRGCC